MVPGLILASGGLFAGGAGGERQRREALHGTSRSRIGLSPGSLSASFEANLRFCVFVPP
jgi:hypothetical protein